MKPQRPQAAPVPTHWTPQQALAVFECLQALRERPLDFDPDDPF